VLWTWHCSSHSYWCWFGTQHQLGETQPLTLFGDLIVHWDTSTLLQCLAGGRNGARLYKIGGGRARLNWVDEWACAFQWYACHVWQWEHFQCQMSTIRLPAKSVNCIWLSPHIPPCIVSTRADSSTATLNLGTYSCCYLSAMRRNGTMSDVG